MSCFKIPISLCKRIQSLLTRFWWDSSPEKRKISWIAWKKLALPKALGGLGFRDIKEFNISLLTKLSWRILNRPQSLLSQVLLGKYCVDESFMDCKPSLGSSHSWQGILAGKDLLSKGLGWIVGNGKSINVWSDPWLSTTHALRPFGPPTLRNKDLKVSDLLDPISNEWNISAIRQNLPQYEDVIRCIIPSSHKPADYLAWLGDKARAYSSKSGYFLAAKTDHPPAPSAFSWTKAIWFVKTSPKITHFLWRVANEALPVGDLLSLRGIPNASTCKRCVEKESIEHILYHCPVAISVWSLAPLDNIPVPASRLSTQSFLSDLSRCRVLPPVGLSTSALHAWILWQLWNARNKLLLENKQSEAGDILSMAINAAKEWEEAMTQSQAIPTPLKPLAKPRSPHIGSCFSDGAWNPLSRGRGMGWTITSASGSTILKDSSHRWFVCSALAAEALAARSGLLATLEAGVSSIQLCSDSEVFINSLISGTEILEIAGILLDIRNLVTLFSHLSFHYVPRASNSSTDLLAKSALYSLSPLGVDV